MIYKKCPCCNEEMVPGHNQNPYRNLFNNKPFKCNKCSEHLQWENNRNYLGVKYGFTAILFLVLFLLITTSTIGFISIYLAALVTLLAITTILSLVCFYKINLVSLKI